jgi:hypothetical protein
MTERSLIEKTHLSKVSTMAASVPVEPHRSFIPSRATLSSLVESLALLAAVGLIAIGTSGLLAEGFGAAFGKSFVSGDAKGVTYTPARCAEFMEYEHTARTCEKAATLHHFGEVVVYREAAGVLGVIALGGFWIIRRANRKRYGDARALPNGFTATVGSSLFGAAALGLIFLGLGQTITGPSAGAGEYLSAGVVSFFVFVWFARGLLRALRDSEAR